jgi:segregation and condensation protein A
MEDSRTHILSVVQRERTLSFEKIFEVCENRLHAIFLFLSMLELVQQNYMNILIGEGRNNFIVEFNAERPDDPEQDLDFHSPRVRKETDEDIRDDRQGLFPGFLDPSAN